MNLRTLAVCSVIGLVMWLIGAWAVSCMLDVLPPTAADVGDVEDGG